MNYNLHILLLWILTSTLWIRVPYKDGLFGEGTSMPTRMGTFGLFLRDSVWLLLQSQYLRSVWYPLAFRTAFNIFPCSILAHLSLLDLMPSKLPPGIF
jgi:hypothetical protein